MEHETAGFVGEAVCRNRRGFVLHPFAIDLLKQGYCEPINIPTLEDAQRALNAAFAASMSAAQKKQIVIKGEVYV